MKKLLIVMLILAFCSVSAFATESRIESMGKSDRYLQDEVSMFTNPAYFLIYPNVLTGSLGKYNSSSWPYYLSGQYFGGWVTVNNVVVGGAFNRHNELEDVLINHGPITHQIQYDRNYYILYDTLWERDTVQGPVSSILTDSTRFGHDDGNGGKKLWIVDSVTADTVTVEVPNPIGETDLFLGYNLGNLGIGAHAFLSQQSIILNGVETAASGVIRGDLGLLMKLNDKDLLDVVLTIARVNYFSSLKTQTGTVTTNLDDLSEAKWSYGASAKAYLTVGKIGGQVVPSFKIMQFTVVKDTTITVSPGVGYIREIEGGMFWAGLDYTYTKTRNEEVLKRDSTITHSTVFSFGIEKQVAWPWFTLRVGGKKELTSSEYRPNAESGQMVVVSKSTNSNDDGSYNDVIGAGMSFKVGKNLRFDVTANERIPFDNPFNATEEKLVTRISATYAF